MKIGKMLAGTAVILLSAVCGLVIVHHSVTGEWPTTPADLAFWHDDAIREGDETRRSWTLPMRDSATIVVDATDADIQVSPTDSASATVEIWLAGMTIDPDNYTSSVRMVSPGMLRVNAKATESWQNWQEGHARIIIHAPRATAITVTSVRGNTTIGEMNGRTIVQTYGGGIRLMAGEGPIELQSNGGSVAVERHIGAGRIVATKGTVTTNMVQGALTISANGDISVRRHFGHLTATSDGGGITADLLSPDSVCTLTTHLGDISLRIPHDARTTVDAFTSEGGIVNELSVGEHQGERVTGSWLQLLGGGGFPIILRSYRGTITVGEYFE
ncbi:MAG: DUF4097 family beta strand repeat-containing protein [Bacteroidota bacterium]